LAPENRTRIKKAAPSILSADFANLEKEIKAVTAAGADWIHVDVMDGHFVKNITIGPPVVKSLSQITSLPLDVHLMIEKPERYVTDFVRAGATYLTIHVEATENPAEVLRQIRSLGAHPGITLRPATPVEKVLPLLPLADLVLVMTVEPGFGGQEFMPEQVAKISRLRTEIDHQKLRCLIEVDGGVNEQSLPFLKDVDVFVAGSFVFKNDYKKAIHLLKS
jgi:ribulose-phosphate 3-epimerase